MNCTLGERDAREAGLALVGLDCGGGRIMRDAREADLALVGVGGGGGGRIRDTLEADLELAGPDGGGGGVMRLAISGPGIRKGFLLGGRNVNASGKAKARPLGVVALEDRGGGVGIDTIWAFVDRGRPEIPGGLIGRRLGVVGLEFALESG